MTNNQESDHAKKMALPSLVGRYVGQQMWGQPWIAFPWIKHIEQRILEAILDKTRERFLIINAPPQTGKSSYVGALLPFWLTGMMPDLNLMYISYSDDFSESRSKDVRALQKAWGKELFGTSIDPDHNKVAEWRILGHRGGMLSVGIGGLITGKPGDCFPGDTLVSTPQGPRRMDWLARNGGTVWGYDHDAGTAVPRRIVASAAKGKRPLVEVIFTSGRRLRCTADHPIYVVGKGYTPARLVEGGAEVRAHRVAPLQSVRDTRSDARVRVRQEDANGEPGNLLRQALLRHEHEIPCLRQVWGAGLEGQEVLLAGVPGGSERRVATDGHLPDVRRHVQAEVVSPAVLFSRLRQHRTLGADDRRGQLALQGRNLLLEVVSGDATPGARSRRRELRRLPVDRSAGRSPCGSQPAEQRPDESNRPVQLLPYEAPQVDSDTVSLVRPVCGGGVEVYDIQVEGTHNFFAGEVLVHNCILIDDLIKNDVEARSESAKKGHLAEWDGTIATRLQPGGTVIVIATRWAEDDLSGALIARMQEPGYAGPQWEVISFPAFAEPSEEMEGELTPEELVTWRDIIGREFGEVLDCRFSRIPGRDPDDYFNIVKASRDPMKFASLYQQRPFSAEGSMFKRENWRYYNVDERPEMEQVVRVWDLAGTEAGGDWTAGTKMGRANGKMWILDVQRFRHASGTVLNKVIETAGVDGYGCAILVEEEKGGAGKSTVAALQKMLPGYNLDAAKAEGDKRSRATLYSSEQQNNRVMLPEEGSVAWDVKGFKDEHVRMMQDGRLPKHDDRIDTGAYGALFLVGGQPVEMWVPEFGEALTPEALMNRLLGEPVVGGGYT